MADPRQSSPAWILFLCTGNICRSAFGQHYLARSLGQQAPGAFEVRSAGARVNPRLRVPDQVRELPRIHPDVVAALGGHEPAQLSPAMAREADLILAATEDHVASVLRETPDALKRTFTVLEFAALARLMLSEGAVAQQDLRSLARSAARLRSRVRTHGNAPGNLDLADPYGGPDEGYQVMGEQMAPALDRIAELLVAQVRQQDRVSGSGSGRRSGRQ